MATNDQILSELTALRKDFDSLTKLVRKVKNTVEDPNGEKAAARRNNPNNGFNRPRQVTSELKEFLGLAPDAMISRTEVTKGVYGYIRENNLKHPDNGKIIMPDAKLKAILGTDDDIQISFTNIQKFISPHYIKDDPATAATPAPTVVAPTVDPADLNGDGRTTRSEAAEHAERTESPAVVPVATPPASPAVTSSPTPKKKVVKVVKTVKKAVVRKPVVSA